jgi:hypothetical protein
MDSICLSLSIAATKGWEFHQMDVKNKFIHGYILRKYTWSNPKASRSWYAKIDYYLLSHKFICCKSNLNVYMLRMANSLLILVLYVDDLMITGFSTSMIVVFKSILHDRFLMKDIGLPHFFLGLEIS